MNGGIIIQERACPRCAHRRTVRVGNSARLFCFNCRHAWAASDEHILQAPWPALDSYVFQPAELARLRMYRAAVRAGFFTDEVKTPVTL
jgi:hypothetical protein